MFAIDEDRLHSYLPELIAIRRDLHAHPETAFEEVRTSALIAERLKTWGVEVHEGVGGTGVVGVIRGTRPGQRCIGLRADIDALNILEKNTFDHASTISGKMHACGHDGHTTMLLGAARYLAQDPDFAGTVHLIFQPAEENGKGAPAMIRDGLFERFPCDAVYGLHTHPGQAVGEIATRQGAALAGSLTFSATFVGTAGHGGAAPHLARDATLPAAHFILALQSIVGRNVPSLDAAVISVGHISGGAMGSPNVMPAQVQVSGTARYFKPEVLEIITARLKEQADCFARAHHCEAQVTIDLGTPPLVNHAEAFDVAVTAAGHALGRDKVDTDRALSTGAEDFAFLAQKVPGAYVWMGGGVGADGRVHDVHTDCFDFNDGALVHGISYWLNVVGSELRGDVGSSSALSNSRMMATVPR